MRLAASYWLPILKSHTVTGVTPLEKAGSDPLSAALQTDALPLGHRGGATVRSYLAG